ncbi:MAG: SDR family NAD(P)-dependent oxidoreductase, partial [Sphingomonas sp.]
MTVTVPQQSILITGAASGIGLATARRFVAQGWRVGCFDVDRAGLARLGSEIGEAGYVATLDVSDVSAVHAEIAAFGEWSGGTLDILFSNAGIDAKGSFDTMDWERIVRVIQVNLMGTFAVIRAGLPLLKRTSNSLCLVTASASAIVGAPGMAAYSASKSAVRSLVEALAVEFASSGVRAADILPGIVDTGMLPADLKARLPTDGMWRPIAAEEVAEVVM